MPEKEKRRRGESILKKTKGGFLDQEFRHGNSVGFWQGIDIRMILGMVNEWSDLPWLTKVEFSSQKGFSYDDKAKDFDDDGQS